MECPFWKGCKCDKPWAFLLELYLKNPENLLKASKKVQAAVIAALLACIACSINDLIKEMGEKS